MWDINHPLGEQDIPKAHILQEFDSTGCSEVLGDIKKWVQNLMINCALLAEKYPLIGNVFDKINKKI